MGIVQVYLVERPRVRVRIETVPPGGEVWIDGDRCLGTAPVEVDVSDRFRRRTDPQALFVPDRCYRMEGADAGLYECEATGLKRLGFSSHMAVYDVRLGAWRGGFTLEAGIREDGAVRAWLGDTVWPPELQAARAGSSERWILCRIPLERGLE